MNFKKLLKNKELVFVVLGVISLVLLFIVGDLMRCPEYYTRVQVGATGCTVGANIGLGFIIFILIVVIIASAVAWLGFYRSVLKLINTPIKKSKKQR